MFPPRFTFLSACLLAAAFNVSAETPLRSTGKIPLPIHNGDIALAINLTVRDVETTGTLELRLGEGYVERTAYGLNEVTLKGEVRAEEKAFGYVEANVAVYDDAGRLMQTGKTRSGVQKSTHHWETIRFDPIGEGPRAASIEISVVESPPTPADFRAQIEAEHFAENDDYEVYREGDTLYVGSDANETTMAFRDEPSDHEGFTYTYLGKLKFIPYHLLERREHEDQSCFHILIHQGALTEERIAGPPLLSPGKSRFASFANFPRFAVLEIFRIEEGDFESEFKLECWSVVDECGPADVEWVGEDAIRFQWKSPFDVKSNPSTCDGFPAAVIRTGEGWQLIK